MSITDFLGPAARRNSGRFELVHVESGAVLASRVIVGGDRSQLPASPPDWSREEVVRIAARARWLHTFSSRAPIDVAFVAADGTILEIRRAMKPWRVAMARAAHAVIEAPPGFLRRRELEVGDRVAVREAQAARPVRDLVVPPREFEATPAGIQELDANADPWDVGALDAPAEPAAREAEQIREAVPARTEPEPRAIPARPRREEPAAVAAAPAPAPAPRAARRRAPARGATLSQLTAGQTPIEWFEAVAIIQGLCQVLLETPPPGGRGMPEADDIAIGPEGHVELLAEGPLEAPVVRVARLLHALAEGTALPVQLRLLVLQELSPSPGCKSVLEFSTRLALFERPGRANLIREVYERFTRLPPREAEFTAPAPAPAPAAHPQPEPQMWRRRRAVVAAGAAALALVVLFVAGAWLRRSTAPPPPGTADHRGTVARAVGDAGASVASAASESAKTVSRWFGIEPAREPAAPAPVEIAAPLAAPPSASVRRAPARVLKPSPSAEGTAAAEDPTPAAAVDPDIYSAASADVVPPVPVRSRQPSSPPRGVREEDLPEVEVVVSPSGQVESVKLLTTDAGVLPSMMLSAIKNWHFEPATRNGSPVRYRMRMRLTNQ